MLGASTPGERRPRARGRRAAPRRRSARRCSATSSAASRKLTGTQIRPEPLTRRRTTVSSRAELCDTIATRSPWPDAEPVERRRPGPGPARASSRVGERRPSDGAGWSGSSTNADAVGVDGHGPAQEVADGQRNLHGPNPTARCRSRPAERAPGRVGTGDAHRDLRRRRQPVHPGRARPPKRRPTGSTRSGCRRSSGSTPSPPSP